MRRKPPPLKAAARLANSVPENVDSGVSDPWLEELEAYVEARYLPEDVVSTLHFDGMDYDCIPLERQPSAVALGLTREDIQAAVAGDEDAPDETQDFDAGPGRPGFLPEPCPAGTVPFEHYSREQLVDIGSLDAVLGRKGKSLQRDSGTHFHSVMKDTGNHRGMQANVNVWNYDVDSYYEFSLMQLWMVDGTGSNTNTIELGVQEYPSRTTFWTPRIFTFWTTDNYDGTGCYNNNCAGFVKTDPSFAFSASLSAYHSVTGGSQYSMELRINHDIDDNLWRIAVAGSSVGYYPESIFTELDDGVGDESHWGGGCDDGIVWIHEYGHG